MKYLQQGTCSKKLLSFAKKKKKSARSNNSSSTHIIILNHTFLSNKNMAEKFQCFCNKEYYIPKCNSLKTGIFCAKRAMLICEKHKPILKVIMIQNISKCLTSQKREPICKFSNFFYNCSKSLD